MGNLDAIREDYSGTEVDSVPELVKAVLGAAARPRFDAQ